MKAFKEFLIYFVFGSTMYGLIELACRNRTHWTMLIVGGIAFYGISLISSLFSDKSIFLKCTLGSLFVTALELISGIIVNINFNMNVWDYSHIPFNILGQICPSFIFLWFVICIPANVLISNIKSYIQ